MGVTLDFNVVLGTEIYNGGPLAEGMEFDLIDGGQDSRL